MSAFADRLRELREKATPGEWSLEECDAADPDGQLIAYLVNHSAEIEALVRAAHDVYHRWQNPTFRDLAPVIYKMQDVLAALEKKAMKLTEAESHQR